MVATPHVFVAWLFALCIVVQAFLAGLSIFAGPGRWAIHIEAGHWFVALPLLLLLAFLVYLPDWWILHSAKKIKKASFLVLKTTRLPWLVAPKIVNSVLLPPPHGSGGPALGLGSDNVSRYSVAIVAQSGSSGCHHHRR